MKRQRERKMRWVHFIDNVSQAVTPLPSAGRHQKLQQRYRGATVEDDDAFLEGVEERIQARKARMATTMNELAP
jgi:hypothetical protein